jgi:hypothetical protein
MKRPSLERMSGQMRYLAQRQFFRKVWSESRSRRLTPALDGAPPSDCYASVAHCKKKVDGNARGSQTRKALAARQ